MDGLFHLTKEPHMAGGRKTDAKEILNRLIKLKTHIDKGDETSITAAANKYLKSSHFTKALLGRDVVHKTKNGLIRWNGLAINLKLAQSVIDGGHAYNKKYWKNKKKAESKTVPPNPHVIEPENNQPETHQSGDVNTILDKKTLERIAKILGVGDARDDTEKLTTAIAALSEDMVRMKAFLFDLHMDHKERMIESITQQIGVQT